MCFDIGVSETFGITSAVCRGIGAFAAVAYAVVPAVGLASERAVVIAVRIVRAGVGAGAMRTAVRAFCGYCCVFDNAAAFEFDLFDQIGEFFLGIYVVEVFSVEFFFAFF